MAMQLLGVQGPMLLGQRVLSHWRMLHQVCKRDPLLEARDHVISKVSWPMERTGQYTMNSE